eukprot:6927223-Prymnesium_polylepis.1
MHPWAETQGVWQRRHAGNTFCPKLRDRPRAPFTSLGQQQHITCGLFVPCAHERARPSKVSEVRRTLVLPTPIAPTRPATVRVRTRTLFWFPAASTVQATGV